MGKKTCNHDYGTINLVTRNGSRLHLPIWAVIGVVSMAIWWWQVPAAIFLIALGVAVMLGVRLDHSKPAEAPIEGEPAFEPLRGPAADRPPEDR